MSVLARHWEKADGGKVRCLLCPHMCLIASGKSGICLIRKNIDGELRQTAYEEVCSIGVDPIEKKPLYHFHPGSNILSVGTNGCNMRCRHCQNWQISTQETARQHATPRQLLKISQDNSSIGIAYTYNEPTIWFEFVYDCAEVFRKAGLKNVLVTNGQINPEPLAELLPLTDAMNIDLKGFTEEFYKNEKGFLPTVLNTIETACAKGVHVEITNLLIPKLNDDPDTFGKMCRYLSGISRDIPLHISRYFPQHKSNQRATEEKALISFREAALEHLNYVYIGNIFVENASDTFCPVCKTKIIERTGYTTRCLTDNNICPNCKTQLSILF
jgi:pyruvate formate lyase activating enzyme